MTYKQSLLLEMRAIQNALNFPRQQQAMTDGLYQYHLRRKTADEFGKSSPFDRLRYAAESGLMPGIEPAECNPHW